MAIVRSDASFSSDPRPQARQSDGHRPTNPRPQAHQPGLTLMPAKEKLQAKKMPRLESWMLSKSLAPLSAGASTVVVKTREAASEEDAACTTAAAAAKTRAAKTLQGVPPPPPPPPRREKLQAKKKPRLESRTLSKSLAPLSAGASTVAVSSEEGDEEPVNNEELAAYFLAHIEEPETPELQSDESSHKWCDDIGSDLD